MISNFIDQAMLYFLICQVSFWLKLHTSCFLCYLALLLVYFPEIEWLLRKIGIEYN